MLCKTFCYLEFVCLTLQKLHKMALTLLRLLWLISGCPVTFFMETYPSLFHAVPGRDLGRCKFWAWRVQTRLVYVSRPIRGLGLAGEGGRVNGVASGKPWSVCKMVLAASPAPPRVPAARLHKAFFILAPILSLGPQLWTLPA